MEILRSYGDPRVPKRIWAKIEVDQTTGCWVWTGNLCGPYAYIYYEGKKWKGGRLFLKLFVRELSQDEHAHHRCPNKACVNPNPGHVEPLPAEKHWGHQQADKTHCKHGHEFTPENTHLRTQTTAKGTVAQLRLCRACNRERARRNANQRSRRHHGDPAEL